MSISFLKNLKVPHVYALLTGVILFCSVMTYLVPAGEYQREERTAAGLTRTMVVPGTYEQLEKNFSFKGLFLGDKVEGKASPVSFLQFLSAIPRGLEKTADIIFFIFVIGGVLNIIQSTGAITAGIQSLLRRFSNSGPLLTVILMVVISIGSSTLGMGEEFIPLVPLFLYVADELGYDRVYGLAIVILAADVGFAAATTNPFTVQIAQGIAEVPIGSGLAFRLIFYSVCMVFTIGYILRYGAKIKKDPTKSLVHGEHFELANFDKTQQAFTGRHKMILLSFVLIFSGIVYAVQKMGWWLAEMSGGFILIGIVAGILGGLTASDTAKSFVKGTEEMIVAALVVGFAKGIQVVLEDGQIMDTLIFGAASMLEGFPKIVAAEGMLIFQSFLNFFIPSGSGQAATTMPLMAPLSDVLGLERQTAVFAFTCGDGFSNTIIPTSGVLMAMLALAKISYEKWLKFMFPLFCILMAISAVFLAIGVMMGF